MIPHSFLAVYLVAFIWTASKNLMVYGFSARLAVTKQTFHKARRPTWHYSEPSSWSIGDDWSELSQESTTPDSEILFNQDLARNAAREISAAATTTLSEEDLWINEMVDDIYNPLGSRDDPPLYDTGFETYTKTISFLDEMGTEIAMLVRCNERPEELLIEGGRALPPLTDHERNNVNQLIQTADTEGTFQATDFLKEAVSAIFHQYAHEDLCGELVLDHSGVAAWMTQSLGPQNEGRISPHDRRVLTYISKYSAYGSGHLTEANFQELYLATIVGDDPLDTSVSVARQLELRQPFVDDVFRDIRNHGILSPIEEERKRLEDEIHAKHGNDDPAVHFKKDATDSIMDECEILDWDYRAEASQTKDPSFLSDRRQGSGSRSSHKVIDMASDGKTPLYVPEGRFGKQISRVDMHCKYSDLTNFLDFIPT